MSKNKVHWAKCLNRHSSKSIWVIKLSFGQNDCPIWGSFWPKDSLITHILFEQCLFRNLAKCTLFLLTLYEVGFRWADVYRPIGFFLRLELCMHYAKNPIISRKKSVLKDLEVQLVFFPKTFPTKFEVIWCIKMSEEFHLYTLQTQTQTL